MHKYLLILLSFILLGGCAAKSDHYDVPEVPLPEGFKNSLTPVAQVTAGDSTTPPAMDVDLKEWWRILQSPELNTLADRAVANNPDVRIATLRIPQTLARMVVAGAAKLPEISVPLRVESEAPANGVGTTAPGGKVRSRTTTQVSLRADWRPDIWGETAASYESSEFQLWRATFQRDELQRTMVANVVDTYLAYLSLNDRLRVAHETETVLSEMLASVEARLESGDATVTEREQQKAAVYAVRATIPVLRQQREVMTNRLASLLGTVPGSLRLSEQGLDSVVFPATLPKLPSSYLLHRPDVRVVEARLLAANADIDVARTRLLPPLDLSAQIGYGSYYLSQLFQPHSLAWNAIANLSATIFDNGKRSGEVDFARSVHEEMTETYVRVIYDAMREVEDAVSAINLMGTRQAEQRIATDASRQAWSFSKESYASGAVDYLVVLDTERTYHRNLDELYSISMERYRGLVNLFSALGGGTPRGSVIPGRGARPSLRTEKGGEPVAADLAVSATPQAAAPPGTPNHMDAAPTSGRQVDATSTTGETQPRNAPLAPEAAGQDTVAGIDWSELDLDTLGDYWLVELAGVYERSTVNSAWRDLRNRFPEQTNDLTLWRRQEGKVDGKNEERASWYRLFLAKYENREQAEELCTAFQGQQLRCRAINTRSFVKKQ